VGEAIKEEFAVGEIVTKKGSTAPMFDVGHLGEGGPQENQIPGERIIGWTKLIEHDATGGKHGRVESLEMGSGGGKGRCPRP